MVKQRIHAYREIYLNKSQSVVGEAFDYAINLCGITGNDFVKFFIASSISKRIENGEPAYVAGKSGIEIVHEILTEIKGQEPHIKTYEQFGRSVEYWVGWAVCYYQWHSGRTPVSVFVLSKCMNKETKTSTKQMQKHCIAWLKHWAALWKL